MNDIDARVQLVRFYGVLPHPDPEQVLPRVNLLPLHQDPAKFHGQADVRPAVLPFRNLKVSALQNVRVDGFTVSSDYLYFFSLSGRFAVFVLLPVIEVVTQFAVEVVVKGAQGDLQFAEVLFKLADQLRLLLIPLLRKARDHKCVRHKEEVEDQKRRRHAEYHRLELVEEHEGPSGRPDNVERERQADRKAQYEYCRVEPCIF